MEKLVIQNTFAEAKDLLPHEEVLEDRKSSLMDYIRTSYEEIILPSILICSKTNVIIDGHHRFFALTEMGITTIPITKIDYYNPLIITHIDPQLRMEKDQVIQSSLSKKMLPPKSTIHRIVSDTNTTIPLILLSKLSLINKQ